MPLTVDTNSYVSLPTAENYFEGRLGSAAWDDASDADKIAALITAAKTIDRQRYTGAKTVSTQTMAFPRTGLLDHNKLAVSSATVPQDIIDAQCEEALARLTLLAYEAKLGIGSSSSTTDTNTARLGGIKSEKIGDAEISYYQAEELAGSGTTNKVESLLMLPSLLSEPTLQSPVAIRLLSAYFLRTPTKVW